METVSRRKLLAAGSTAAVATALVGAGSAAAQGRATRPAGQPQLEWLERYIITYGPTDMDSLRTPASATIQATGPQYWTGAIWNDGDVGADGTPGAGATRRGTYRAYAWVWAAGANPSFEAVHVLDIAGRGSITASGTTDSSVAITGGTGEFQGARGEARMNVLSMSAIALELDLNAPNVGR